MKQKKRKKYFSNYNLAFDRILLNDRHLRGNYLYSYIKNGLNSGKTIKDSHSQLEFTKKSTSPFYKNKNGINKSNSNLNKSVNKSVNINNSQKSQNGIGKISESQLDNKMAKSSSFNNKNNQKSKSLPKNNKKINLFWNNNKNLTGFIGSLQRVKTPLMNKNGNKNMKDTNFYKFDFQKNQNNKLNKNKLNNIGRSKKTYRNYTNIFQPVNIFSQFKNKPTNNNNEEPNQLYKQILNESRKLDSLSNEKPKNLKLNQNNNNKSINTKNNLSINVMNNTNTNATTPISSGNLFNNISNSNKNLNSKTNKLIFDKNIDCHEINFHVEGISSSINLCNNFKKKIFKGKKIKCMHDLSKTGLAGDEKKVNQDNFFIFKNFVQGFDNIFMGVCDGHGYYGHEVSGYIKENLPMDLNHLIKTKRLNILTDDLAPTIKSAFILENKSLLRNRQIDSDLSGSTCISVIYTPQKLIIANIGDSRCVIGKLIENENSEEKDEIVGEKNQKKIKCVAENLSRDHKPTIPEEADRILKVGGRIRQMKDEDGEFIGPLRVYMKDKDMPGLAMTRSFGDYFGSTAGVISEPEVSEYFFKPEDKFMVLASDGLFEFMESQEVINIIKDYYDKNDIVGCCEYLYKESARKWIQEEEDTIDDITMILVFFDDLYEEVEE